MNNTVNTDKNQVETITNKLKINDAIDENARDMDRFKFLMQFISETNYSLQEQQTDITRKNERATVQQMARLNNSLQRIDFLSGELERTYENLRKQTNNLVDWL